MKGRPRNEEITSEVRHCRACGADTEHREYRRGQTRTGRQRTEWTCVPCNRAKALAGYRRRVAA